MKDFIDAIEGWGESTIQLLAYIGANALIGGVIAFVVLKALNVYAARRDVLLAFSTAKRLRKALYFFLPLLLMVVFMEPAIEALPNLVFFKQWILVGFYLSFCFVLIRMVYVFSDSVEEAYDMSHEDNLHVRKIHTQLQYVRRVLIIIILIMAVSAVLLTFESVRKLGIGLLSSAGVMGVVLGIAAQKSISNLLAGLQIAFTQPIRIDDVVVVEGEWGKIEEIALTYVVVRIWDLRRLVLPLNYFIEKPFQNWTRTSADLLATVFIYADYTLPIEPVRKELTRLLEKDPLWDKKVNVVQLTNATDRVIEIRALMSARNSPEAFDLRCHVREGLITFIQENYPDSLPKTRVGGIADQGLAKAGDRL